MLFVIGITPLYFYIYCKFYYTHDFEIYQDIIVNISIILHFIQNKKATSYRPLITTNYAISI